MNSEHIKSVNEDGRSKKRLRFKSSSQRAKSASADVYRPKRRLGTLTSASTREVVHFEGRNVKKAKLAEKDDQNLLGMAGEEEFEATNFAQELDLAFDRNASEIFNNFHRQIWHLVRSLPEILHHKEAIINILVEYMLSPEEQAVDDEEEEEDSPPSSTKRKRFVINHATTDILHLLAVLAKDLRSDIHPYLSIIMNRILYDLLTPPIDPRKQVQVDVSVVEASFRTLAYIFRYDTEALLVETGVDNDAKDEMPCLEPMRKWYGVVLSHRRDVVRRLAAETFAPLIRRLPDAARKKHLKRVLRALVVSSTKQPEGHSARRLRTDAVDGISQLMFQVARGVKGRLHSKGMQVIKCVLDCLLKNVESEVLFQVTSSFLLHLYRFLEPTDAVSVATVLIGMAKARQPCFMSLVCQMVSFRNRSLLKQDETLHVDIVTLVKASLGAFGKSDMAVKAATLDLLCAVWKESPEQDRFASEVSGKLRSALDQEVDETLSPALILAEKLLPYLSPELAMKSIGSAIVASAANIASQDGATARTLVHALLLSTKSRRGNEDDSDSLFDLSLATFCEVSKANKSALVNAFMGTSSEPSFSDPESAATIAMTAECLAFSTVLGSCDDSTLKKVSRWFLQTLQAIASERGYIDRSDASLVVVFSVALDCISRCCLLFLQRKEGEVAVRRTLSKLQSLAEKHLAAGQGSLWSVRCVASFSEAHRMVGMSLTLSVDEMFDLLVPNLGEPCHFQRLHTLRILNSLPKLPFVVDHAEIDLTDDLDEEPSTAPSQEVRKSKMSGLCDLMSILLDIETTPICLSSERTLLTHVSRVEVLARSGRLPVAYTDAACRYFLGLFHVKFAPVWSAAVKALAALVKTHNSVWPAIFETVRALTDDRSTKVSLPDENESDPNETHFDRCLKWERSNGAKYELFKVEALDAREHGRISRFETADEDVVFETAWSLFAQVPGLLTQHSRSVIPVFLTFVHTQFFFDPKDSDARELCLADNMEESSRREYEVRSEGRRTVERKLLAILKAFAAVKGPDQFYKCAVVKSIFVALLGNPEASVAQLALSCLLKFKDPHLVAYGDVLKQLFVKGKFRESLFQLKTMFEETEGVDRGGRKLLVPILTRVLFGRLVARSVGKFSKDSPEARRNSVLSTLAAASQDDDDLYPAIYLMTRAFAPIDMAMKPVQHQDSDDVVRFAERLSKLEPSDVDSIPAAVHQGFLNMLSAVLSQWGYRSLRFVPVFVAITLSIAKLYEVRESQGEGTLLDATEELVDESDESDPSKVRSSTIRALCYRRIADLMDKFNDSVDFESIYARLGESLRTSIPILPSMASSSARVPSLLALFVALSRHRSMTCLFEAEEGAVVSVIRCISPRNSDAVVDAALSFVINLLGNEEVPGTGPHLIRKHLADLLSQLRQRLESVAPDGKRGSYGNERSSRAKTWRRELEILFTVSKFIRDDSVGVDSHVDSELIQSLFDLLVPFLRSGFTFESDVPKILEIMNVLSPRIADDVALSHYIKLGQLLGPSKGKASFSNKEIRRGISTVIHSLATSSLPKARRVAGVVLQLTAYQTKRVDEIDYDVLIPALSSLHETGSEKPTWISLCSDESGPEPTLLEPLVHSCFHLLFSEDGVVSRGSLKALKSLVHLAALGSNFNSQSNRAADEEKWRRLLSGCIIPLARGGIHSRDEGVRRFFILILGEIGFKCKDSDSPHLHGDLAQLVREDEPDLDFFKSITHVQIHRRARALQRLRKLLVSEGDAPFHPQTLSNVLLPLALHPIYEVSQKIEEAFALEAIATAGAIARLLSWSKYSSLLSTTLNQFQRHPDQETYLVGLLCSVIDAFHFDVTATNDESDDATGSGAVYKAVENRLVPKVESLLVKESTSKHGEKTKMLRPSMTLALLKLCQKLPQEYFESKLPRLLTIICDILKSRESNARDTARNTLAKMVCAMDLVYLPDVVRELAISLSEGYQLHVRTATIHTILLELSQQSSKVSPAFDSAIPGIVDLLQQDLFGGAQERKDAKDNQVRYVKEASGSKSYNCLELVSSMVLFRPSSGAANRQRSAVHTILSPLLERLRDQSVSALTIRRIRECLTRAVTGFARNPSVTIEEALSFVFSTIEPFVERQEIESVMESLDDGSDDEDGGTMKPIVVSGSREKEGTVSERKSQARVTEWRPSTLGAPMDAARAFEVKRKDEKKRLQVSDGSSAPKLTGSDRLRSATEEKTRRSVNDPASIAAVVFGLQLLYSCLKKTPVEKLETLKDMLDPFVPLLTACVCRCSETEVVLLALRILGLLLRLPLPSHRSCSKALASKTLDLLTSSGLASNRNQETIQASFKMLSMLMVNVGPKTGGASRTSVVPLTSDQMQVLVSFLQGSIVDSEQHSSAVGLVKAIVSLKYVSAEVYDLMETILEQSVRSPNASLRQHSASLFVAYLVNYPLAPRRIEQHLKQMVLNVTYELPEGRLSAIALLTTVINKVPQPVVEEQYQLFFLPLTLQLVNDESKECREAVAQCIVSLLKRLSTESLQSLFDYAIRWSKEGNDLRRTSMQVLGIFADACPDFVKRRNLLDYAEEALTDATEDWEVPYFALVLTEKAIDLSDDAGSRTSLWLKVIKAMRAEHPWVRLVACRVLTKQLTPLELDTLSSSKTFLTESPGSLYEAARSYCHQLHEDITEDIVGMVVKSLTWILEAMHRHPQLCYESEPEDESKDPTLWLITRLSNLAKRRDSQRRHAVYKCFAAFGTFCVEIIEDHLERILEPLYRSEVETQAEIEANVLTVRGRPTNAIIVEEAELAKDVLRLLEENCDSHGKFLEAYANVKKRAQSKKEERKMEEKTQAVVDPIAAAKRRIQKQEREKQRRKRRADENRRARGGTSKRRHVD